MVVLDTCAIIEGCKKHGTFTSSTLSKIEKGAYILPISFAEIACKIQLGKLELGISARDLHEDFTQIREIIVVDSIHVPEWLDSVELIWPENKDPVDRLLVAFAMKKQIPIVTTDKKIKNFYQNVIW